MTPRIETLKEKKLVGQRLRMSLANNRTGQLWSAMTPRRKEITNSRSSDVISLQIYDSDYFRDFNPAKEFEKWALIEVSDFDNLPDGMEKFTLPAGLYAIFNYKGSSNDPAIFQYIYGEWLPGSGYVLDDRPHFEVLGEKYKNNDPESEEQIWIPIKSRS